MIVGKFAVVFGCIVILLFAGAAKGCDAPNYNPHDQERHQPAPTGAAMTQGHNEPIECTVARVPPDKPDLDKKRYITVYGCVEKKYGPVDLSIFVKDHSTGEKGSHDEPSAGGEVQYVIGYDSGHNVKLNIDFKPSRPGSQQGFLYVSDGPTNKKVVPIEGGWRAQVLEFTSQR